MLQKGLKYTEAEISVDEDGNVHRLTEGLTLIDAVLPEVVAIRQNLHNQQKQAIKTEPTSGGETNGEETTVAAAPAPPDNMEVDQSIEIPASKVQQTFFLWLFCWNDK